MAKPGPKPLGEQAMTAAERQARYRAARADGAPKVKYRKPVDRRSRPEQWRDAVATLVRIQDECQQWLDGLPPSLGEGAVAEKLQALCDFDLSELQSLEPPKGFGRD